MSLPAIQSIPSRARSREMVRAVVVFTATLLIAACGGGGEAVIPGVVELGVSVVRPGASTQSRVTSKPAGIDGESISNASDPGGALVKLTPGAAPGERFSAWSDTAAALYTPIVTSTF